MHENEALPGTVGILPAVWQDVNRIDLMSRENCGRDATQGRSFSRVIHLHENDALPGTAGILPAAWQDVN